MAWSSGCISVLNALALVPLVSLQNFAAEEIAARLGKTFGGLFNAIVGTSARPILRLLALCRGESTITRTSGLGTVLITLLLTPGLSFLCGFYFNARDQYGQYCEIFFDSSSLEVTVSQLVPAIFLILVPSLIRSSHEIDAVGSAKLDLFVHIISPASLLVLFGLVLYFHLQTHAHLFGDEDPDMILNTDLEDVDYYRQPGACVCRRTGIFTQELAGTIILPIVTEGASIVEAVIVAIRGRTDRGLTDSLSTALDVAMIDTPLLGIASWVMQDSNARELVFTTEEAAAIGIALITSVSTTNRGKSSYIDGFLLVSLYAFLITVLCYL
ncbi:hypothetical protein V8F06_008167 [Rhypophila decipiens]